MSKKKTPKYWICDLCAIEKELIYPTWPVTVSLGECDYCKSKTENWVTPIVDFEDPKTGRKPVWD